MFSKILKIINSALIFVFFVYLADNLYGTITYQPLINLNIIIFPFLKSYFLSGIFGAIVEVTSKENIVFNKESIFRNANHYWILLLLFSICPFAIYFISFITIGIFEIMPFNIAYAMFSLIIYYLLSNLMIRDKYLKPLNISNRKFKLSSRNTVVIAFLYLLNIFCENIIINSYISSPMLLNIMRFCSIYLQLIMFSYFTALILDHYPEIAAHNESQKELFLVNPINGGIISGFAFKFSGLPPASVFAIFKAITPKHYKIREFNRLYWRKRYFRKNKLVAITCFTSNAFEAYAIAKGFKDAGSKVVMGGPHISCLPDEALEYCDSVVIGDCESVWPDIIQDYENDSLKQKYFKPISEEDHHKVNAALLDLSPQDIAGYLETTRGCKFQCDFCSVPYLSNAAIYKRPIADVIALLNKAKTQYKHLGFIDTNLFNNPQYAKELFAEMKKLNITWRMQCTIDIAKDDEALRLAKESGCTSMLFGYEIIAGSKEKEKKGKYSMADKYVEFTKKIQKLGIKVKAQFIFGFENDTLRNIFDIWKFSLAIMPEYSSTSLLTPLPGSKFYNKVSSENRITNLNWRRYSLSYMVFKHNNLKSSTVTRLFPLIYSFINLTASSGGLIISFLTLFSVTIITISIKLYFILLNIK